MRILEGKERKVEGSSVATHGWFSWFRNPAHVCNVSVSGEAVIAGSVAAEEFLNLFA
jgi:hypothetical protein